MKPDFYIVRSSWDTGYEDFDCNDLVAANKRKWHEIEKICQDTGLANFEAFQFVIIYAATRI